jgi:hypothetical protein
VEEEQSGGERTEEGEMKERGLGERRDRWTGGVGRGLRGSVGEAWGPGQIHYVLSKQAGCCCRRLEVVPDVPEDS